VETVRVLTEFWWKLGLFRLQRKCHGANAIRRAMDAPFRLKATGGPPSCDFQLHIESSAAGSVNVGDLSVILQTTAITHTSTLQAGDGGFEEQVYNAAISIAVTGNICSSFALQYLVPTEHTDYDL
jgi:hypothetical protein